MDFQNIINKYHYEGWLAEFLPKVHQELKNSLGEEYEPIIYEALLNTEIVIANNVYDALAERNLADFDENSGIKKEDYMRASGVNVSDADISFDGESFKIEGIKRLVIITQLTKEFENAMFSSLIHELGHLVKSYYNEYKIEGNILIQNSGLIRRTYKMEYVDGKVKKTLLSEKGVGLEEGLNTALEVEIGQKLIDPNWEAQGYKVVTGISSIFLNNKTLRTMITAAQMDSDVEDLTNSFDDYFMDNSYERFESILDKLYFLGLKQTAAIFNPPKMEEITEEINVVIRNEFNPLMEQMGASRAAKRN